MATVEHVVPVAEGVDLWVEERGDPAAPVVLLVMGANASGLTWPEELVDRLARRYRVVRYDHRDTGRSSRAFDERPYALRDLAGDAVRVLDALGVERAHVVGMSMGGVLVQLLLLDAPQRLRSATVFATAALGAGLADTTGAGELPGPAPELLQLWQELGAERDEDAELAWRVEHWRVLNGPDAPFDPEEFRELERRVAAHSGTWRSPTAHALADPSGLERGAELAAVGVPVLVVEAPADPVNPPPHARHLAEVVGSARLVTVPGMGHALPRSVLGPLADALEEHVDAVEAGDRPVASAGPYRDVSSGPRTFVPVEEVAGALRPLGDGKADELRRTLDEHVDTDVEDPFERHAALERGGLGDEGDEGDEAAAPEPPHHRAR
ncbi:alpha/beta fold hydrolase [Kineococcus terrestris]|uniref:alpha/beta fold hydrolase n=1 Tax=Kineococcus terrestris TaxID=2044856 RepID=UPI0034DB32D2